MCKGGKTWFDPQHGKKEEKDTVVMQTCNISTLEAQAGGLKVVGQPRQATYKYVSCLSSYQIVLICFQRRQVIITWLRNEKQNLNE
jgi:hypothetical protein